MYCLESVYVMSTLYSTVDGAYAVAAFEDGADDETAIAASASASRPLAKGAAGAVTSGGAMTALGAVIFVGG